MQTFDEKHGNVIEQSNKTYQIFENINTKDDSFIYCETLPNYVEERVPITVNLQGYSPNMVFMQGYREVEDSYYVKYVTTKSVINDR